MTNFKSEHFEGTLLELLEHCNGHADSRREQLLTHQEWLLQQLMLSPNLLPIRKGQTYRERGRTVEVEDRRYLIADNEPLASQFQFLLDPQGRPPGSFLELLQAGHVSASWKADVSHPSPLRFRGVASAFRERGLKLAHIFDAADGLNRVEPLARQFELRFLRSQSPLNVFLFPGPRAATVRVVEGFEPGCSDLGEDPTVRGVALGYLSERLGLPPEAWNLFRAGIGDIDLDVVADWERIGRTTRVEVSPGPRRALHPSSPQPGHRVAPQLRGQRHDGFAVRASDAMGAGRWNTARESVALEDAVALLREWLLQKPDVTRLDERTGTGSNPKPWLHFRIDGYTGESVFTSRHGPTFDGRDYNGVVNFHGDTKVDAIRRFLDLYEAAENVQDVLIPSATHETREPATNVRVIRPKFALRACSGAVEGFFLYHDQHPGRRV